MQTIHGAYTRSSIIARLINIKAVVAFWALFTAWLSYILLTSITYIVICSSFLFQGALCIIIITVGAISSAFGTYSALSKIVENLSHWISWDIPTARFTWIMYSGFVWYYLFSNFGFCITLPFRVSVVFNDHPLLLLKNLLKFIKWLSPSLFYNQFVSFCFVL